jgi:hypothetical protein
LPSHLEKTNCIGNLSDQISIKIERENASKFKSEKIKKIKIKIILEAHNFFSSLSSPLPTWSKREEKKKGKTKRKRKGKRRIKKEGVDYVGVWRF